ncbi:MAG TPA: AI-2E family transporter [Xanthobacteraceae bacterium]|nr:AI-2E family transporter [Xanthobacteraceae bacterium]
MPKVLESFKTWLKSANEAWASDVAVSEAPAQHAEAPDPVQGGGRLQSRATVGIFALLVFYFLYFASPILVPIITALLLSMLLAPFVRLLEWVRVPRTLGALIVVLVAVGILFGVAAGLRVPAQSWLTQPSRFARLEEKLRPIAASLAEIQNAIGQLEKAMAPSDGAALQKVEVTPPGLAGLLSSGIGHVASTITAIIGLLYFFLVAGDRFLRKLVLVTPSLKDKKRAVEIVRNIEMDISFYLVMVAGINISIGIIVVATAGILGIPDPFLWGSLAAVLSFAPYVGEFAIIILLSLAGILTFDNLIHALVAPAIYFVVMTICWQGVVPFVVGRRMTLSPVAVFIMIIVLGWMWGVIGALVAVPVLASVKIICDRVGSLRPIAEFLSP